LEQSHQLQQTDSEGTDMYTLVLPVSTENYHPFAMKDETGFNSVFCSSEGFMAQNRIMNVLAAANSAFFLWEFITRRGQQMRLLMEMTKITWIHLIWSHLFPQQILIPFLIPFMCGIIIFIHKTPFFIHSHMQERLGSLLPYVK
jgi:hypothetical protein